MHFEVAPWPGWLKAISVVVSIILIATAGLTAYTIPPPSNLVAAAIAVAVLVGSALFVVRGYTIEPDRLLVQRLLWSTNIDLRGLTRVWHDPQGLRGSIRVFGNGGLFSLTGIFWSRPLGFYRMFATDPEKFVGLALPKRNVVITPADPQAFIKAATTIPTSADLARQR